MTLSAAQVQHWRSEGYVPVPGFFDTREVRALQAGYQELKAAGTLANIATDFDGETHVETKQNQLICPLSFHHPLYRAIPFHAKVRAAVAQLLTEPIYKFQDAFFVKPAWIGSPTNWHQDNYYFEIRDPVQKTAMWVAITDATADNGALRVIPRSHEALAPHTRDPESDHDRRCYPAEDEAVTAELAAGGVLFFNSGTLHATGPNTTDAERVACIFHFLNDGWVTPELASGRPHPTLGYPSYSRPGEEGGPYVSGTPYTVGKREYGCDMEALLAAEIARLAGPQAVAR